MVSDNVVGACGALMCAFLLALGLNIQRFALLPSDLAVADPTADDKRELFCGANLTKNSIWIIGLLIYAFANVPYIIGLTFAPLSLMSAIFASVRCHAF